MDEAALKAKKILLRKIPHGLFVVGVAHGGEANAFTGSWLTQASFEPPRVALGVRRDSGSFALLQKGGAFTVNFLNKQQQPVAEHFVRPAKVVGDKLAGFDVEPAGRGAPILADAIGYLDCSVVELCNADGDHAVVIGEVVHAQLNSDEPALTLMDTPWHYGG